MVNSIIPTEYLSAAEKEAVKQLKQRMVGQMDPELYDDLNLFVRFLRARDMNLNAAETMLRKHLEWRKIFQISSILKNYTPKEVLRKYVTMDIMGMDKEGSPIIFHAIGQVDSRGLLKSARKVEITRYFVHKLETAADMMQTQSLKEGKLIDKWLSIVDFENFPFAVATHKEALQLACSLMVLYEANYPERLKAIYCINASIYFTMAFGVVKHFLSGPTYRKIKIFGKDGWKDELLKIIDPEVLPAFLGGKRTDPDGNPLCNTIVTHGRTIPESYYTKKEKKTLANVPGIKKLVLTRMSKAQLTLDVKECGTNIEWEFETTSKDIGFAVLYKEDEYNEDIKELVPTQRIETDISPESGILKCDRPGIYIIEFDNSYSWLFQKTVYYKISLVKNAI